MRRWAILLGTLLGSALGQGFGFVYYMGFTWTLPTDLTVVQRGYPDAVVKGAEFSGRDFTYPWYYGVRLWYGEAAGLRYELELIHHKLYFEGAVENADLFERFTVTDGFNYLLFNLAYPLSDGPLRAVGRVGVGVMLPHPETEVRGQAYGVDGDWRYYQFGGFGAQVGVSVEPVGSGPIGLTGNLEGKLTLASSRFTIANGYAQGFFFSLHGVLGVGLRSP
ncbi:MULTISPECIES: hypothetical protein [unclassified Meiothermus]|uniref:hypothetical protein n=1 Tax=unclassified Meiothermus TaxID=370471 RepID=UPI000D7C04E1|nr:MULTISPECIES: hypothetical protein [unclassified Meiothermus]PZA08100.1 hypothetical protein DNA98_02825 [Meiothermus sp. Pnk-1]RYM29979.1 hypothetical protein EWH23_15770 [Meiothermus sp. PNK-Is4]